jgi:hypothetical protein
MAVKKKTPAVSRKASKKSMKSQHIDIQVHRERLKEIHGPRTGSLGWVLALLGMAALLWLMNKPI